MRLRATKQGVTSQRSQPSPVSGPPAGASIWLRANDESYSNGANVTQWSDKSGNSRHFTAGSNWPTFATGANNGRSALSFNGTSSGISRSYTGSGTGYTIAGILSQDSDAFRVWWQNGINPYLGINLGRTPLFYRGSGNEGSSTIPFTNWMPLICRANGTTAEIFLGTTRVKSGTITSGALAVTGLGNLSTYWWNGKMQEIIAYESALSDSAMITLSNYLCSEAGKLDTPRQILCEGDSLTEGVAPATSYPSLLQTGLGNGYNVLNRGTGGNTIVAVAGSNGDITSQAATTIDPWLVTSRLDGRKQVVVVWAGTNDLFYGRTGTQAHTDFAAYCTARRSAGARVIAINMIDRRTDGGSWTSTDRNTFNSLFAANSSSYADATYDAAARFTDNTNTTDYNADKIHLTTASNQIVANAIQSLILAG